MATQVQAAITSVCCVSFKDPSGNPHVYEESFKDPSGNPHEAIKVSLEKWEGLAEESHGDTGTWIHLLSDSCLG